MARLGCVRATFFQHFWWAVLRLKMVDLEGLKTGSDSELAPEKVSRSSFGWLRAVILPLKSAILVVHQKTQLFARFFQQNNAFWHYLPCMMASESAILADSGTSHKCTNSVAITFKMDS